MRLNSDFSNRSITEAVTCLNCIERLGHPLELSVDAIPALPGCAALCCGVHSLQQFEDFAERRLR